VPRQVQADRAQGSGKQCGWFSRRWQLCRCNMQQTYLFSLSQPGVRGSFRLCNPQGAGCHAMRKPD